MMAGAYGEIDLGADVDAAHVVEILNGVKTAVEAEANATYEMFQPVAVKRQVVAGTNWKIKVQVAADAYIHVVVFEPLPYTGQPPSVSSVEVGKTVEDEL